MAERRKPPESPTSYNARVFDTSDRNYDAILPSIITIERKAFGDDSFDEAYFRLQFDNPQTTLIVLESGNQIAGFTYAAPLSCFDDDEEYPFEVNRADNGEHTAYIDDMVIDPSQRRGLEGWRALMTALEAELVNKGVKFLEADARQVNMVDRLMEWHYRSGKHGTILQKEPTVESKWGPQTFFRVELARSA